MRAIVVVVLVDPLFVLAFLASPLSPSASARLLHCGRVDEGGVLILLAVDAAIPWPRHGEAYEGGEEGGGLDRSTAATECGDGWGCAKHPQQQRTTAVVG